MVIIIIVIVDFMLENFGDTSLGNNMDSPRNANTLNRSAKEVAASLSTIVRFSCNANFRDSIAAAIATTTEESSTATTIAVATNSMSNADLSTLTEVAVAAKLKDTCARYYGEEILTDQISSVLASTDEEETSGPSDAVSNSNFKENATSANHHPLINQRNNSGQYSLIAGSLRSSPRARNVSMTLGSASEIADVCGDTRSKLTVRHLSDQLNSGASLCLTEKPSDGTMGDAYKKHSLDQRSGTKILVQTEQSLLEQNRKSPLSFCAKSVNDYHLQCSLKNDSGEPNLFSSDSVENSSVLQVDDWDWKALSPGK